MVTQIELNFLVWSLLAMLAILSWVGRLGVRYLSNIADSVNRIEKDIAILSTDHSNLKEEFRDFKTEVKEIKTRIINLENG